METMSDTQNDAPTAWHATSVADVADRLVSHPDGLDQGEREARATRYGPNRLPEPPTRGPLRRFLAQFDNLLIYILLAAAAVTAALGHWVDTGVILAVVVANTVIGFVQEGKAEQALAAIRHMLAPRAAILRAGHRATVAGETLVPGDVVLLEAGDRVPADLRLFESRGLRVEEAILTGESVATDKTPAPVATEAALGDRTSMAYSGTMVTYGSGKGYVVATGAATEIGRISGLLADIGTLTTPLLRQMDVFARYLSLAIVAFASAIFAFGYAVRGYPFGELFIAVVGLMVAAIPEGLPAILTVTLAIGVQGMARRHAIVRRLPAIETLGSVSVICSDKTGTLTRNEMMVASVVHGATRYTLAGTGYTPHGAVLDAQGAECEPGADTVAKLLARGLLLCNDAALYQRDDRWQVEGDPMEGALIAAAHNSVSTPISNARPGHGSMPSLSTPSTFHGHAQPRPRRAPSRVPQRGARARARPVPTCAARTRVTPLVRADWDRASPTSPRAANACSRSRCAKCRPKPANSASPTSRPGSCCWAWSA